MNGSGGYDGDYALPDVSPLAPAMVQPDWETIFGEQATADPRADAALEVSRRLAWLVDGSVSPDYAKRVGRKVIGAALAVAPEILPNLDELSQRLGVSRAELLRARRDYLDSFPTP